MNIIQQITSDTLQKQTLILDDGTSFNLTIEFKPMQFGWFIRELSYGDFLLQGMRICVSPDILYQFKNQLPFGLACFSKDSREPTLQDDFSSGNAKLYILGQSEVTQLSEYFSGQARP